MRDNRIDVIRGLAILLLTITHTVPGQQLLNQFGHYYIVMGFFFHGADIFVSFSGLVCGIVYKRTIERFGITEGVRRGLVRAVQLFFYNTIAFLVVCAIIISFETFGVSTPRHSFTQAWSTEILGTVFLYHPISYFNILNVYIVFLVILPFFVVAQMRSNLPIFGCVVVYVAYGIWRLSGGEEIGDSAFFISPLGWQLAFFGGTFVGMNIEKIRAAAPALRVAIGPIMFYALVSSFMREEGWIVHNFSSKFDFGFLRLVDLILFAYLIDQLVSPTIEITSRAMQKISAVGSNSLFCFACTLVMCFFFSHVLSVVDGSRVIYLAVLLLEVFIIMQLGDAMTRYKAFRGMTQLKWIDRAIFFGRS